MSQRTLKKSLKCSLLKCFTATTLTQMHTVACFSQWAVKGRKQRTEKNTKDKDNSGRSLTVRKDMIKAKWIYFNSGTRISIFKSQERKDSVEPSTSQHCRPKLHVHLKKIENCENVLYFLSFQKVKLLFYIVSVERVKHFQVFNFV